jgi:hypothetical protein
LIVRKTGERANARHLFRFLQKFGVFFRYRSRAGLLKRAVAAADLSLDGGFVR